MKEARFDCEIVTGADGVMRPIIAELYGNTIPTSIQTDEWFADYAIVTVNTSDEVMALILADYEPIGEVYDLD